MHGICVRRPSFVSTCSVYVCCYVVYVLSVLLVNLAVDLEYAICAICDER